MLHPLWECAAIIFCPRVHVIQCSRRTGHISLLRIVVDPQMIQPTVLVVCKSKGPFLIGICVGECDTLRVRRAVKIAPIAQDSGVRSLLENPVDVPLLFDLAVPHIRALLWNVKECCIYACKPRIIVQLSRAETDEIRCRHVHQLVRRLRSFPLRIVW